MGVYLSLISASTTLFSCTYRYRASLFTKTWASQHRIIRQSPIWFHLIDIVKYFHRYHQWYRHHVSCRLASSCHFIARRASRFYGSSATLPGTDRYRRRNSFLEVAVDYCHFRVLGYFSNAISRVDREASKSHRPRDKRYIEAALADVWNWVKHRDNLRGAAWPTFRGLFQTFT